MPPVDEGTAMTAEQEMATYTSASFKDGEPIATPAPEPAPKEKPANDKDTAKDDAAEDTSGDEDEAVAEDDAEDEADAEAGEDDADKETDDEAEASEDEEADVEEDADAEEEVPDKRTRAGRIHELTRKNAAKEAELAETRAQLAEAQRKVAEKQLTSTQALANLPAEPVEPKPDDFEFGVADAKFLTALGRYGFEKAKWDSDKVAFETAQAAQVSDAQAKIANFALKGAKAGIKDFEQVVMQGARENKYALSASYAQNVMGSEVGPQIAHYLASHPAESFEVYKMPAFDQGKHFLALEARFKAAKPAPKTVKKQVLPKVPPPPARRAGGSSGGVSTSPATSDFAQFEAMVDGANRRK